MPEGRQISICSSLSFECLIIRQSDRLSLLGMLTNHSFCAQWSVQDSSTRRQIAHHSQTARPREIFRPNIDIRQQRGHRLDWANPRHRKANVPSAGGRGVRQGRQCNVIPCLSESSLSFQLSCIQWSYDSTGSWSVQIKTVPTSAVQQQGQSAGGIVLQMKMTVAGSWTADNVFTLAGRMTCCSEALVYGPTATSRRPWLAD